MGLLVAIPASAAQAAHPRSRLAAGYVLRAAPASSTASATFKVPKLSCTATTTGVGAGASIVTSSGVAAASIAVLACFLGSPLYTVAVEVGSNSPASTITPKAGDTISVKVSSSAASSRATITDVTQNKSQSVSGGGHKNAKTVLGMAADSAQVPVSNFGTVRFSAGRIDGKAVRASGAIAVDMANGANVLQVLTGALNSTGAGWSETFKHA